MPTPVCRRLVLALLVGVVLLVLAAARLRMDGAAKARAPGGGASTNSPLIGDFADPFVLHEGDTYYAFATGHAGSHVQVAVSRDLTTWKTKPDALPTLPTWALPSAALTWAPSVLPRGRRYVLYYTARHQASGFQCISRAVADRAEGPYVDDSTQPFICQIGNGESLCGSIDPSPFVDADGRSYLLWKSEENSASCRAAPRIWMQELEGDGLALLGSPKVVLTMDQAWEGQVIEGPSMVFTEGRYWLFYSANRYDSSDYAVGYATCRGPMQRCTKATVQGPLLASRGNELGPGGQEFFWDAAGSLWMAYHAWSSPHTTYESGGARSLRLARVNLPRTNPTDRMAEP